MSSVCRVRVTGPLAMYADGFRADLAARGYAAGSADRNLRTMAHVPLDGGSGAVRRSAFCGPAAWGHAAGRATTTRFPSGRCCRAAH